MLVERRRAAEFRTRVAAALLYAGPQAALTSESVLALGGFASASSKRVEILVPYTRRLRRKPGLVIHSTQFSEIDVNTVQGLRVMTPDFALAEVLCRDRGRVGFACMDEALSRYPADDREAVRAAVLTRIMARPDSRGSARARFLVDLATGLAESPPESWTLLLIVDAGWPPPQPQFVVANLAGRELYRLDLAWPEARVAVEYDGHAAHEDRQEQDALRDEDLRRRGWTLIHLTAADLREPGRFLSDLHAALTRGGLAA
ncbi:endonuclease domain-containing protein [Amycolatopsis magusensis]|uniref:endonuclease domain-containing protein n=1 Tax=Amycolatopsis magusensis TaxID=882444 RepID=UPI0024A9E1F1|nr:DUF559 domain-containing protein [Amycolatopsis magusensis]MDI5980132.1 DUF559 domain-containing protein [Amycolatopsis magusensis]